ncbi:MAG: 3-keto-disaccharide hydrolase [Verrucomicrobiia bacterium]
MNRRSFVSASALATASLANAAKKPSWQKMFNGKDIQGWHKPPAKISHGTGGQWFVEGGTLVGEQDPPGSGNGGILLSDQKFSDFELEIDMNPDWGPCSGIFFRCNEKGHGFQMYVDYHDRGNVGHLRGEMPGSFAMMPFKIFGEMDGERLKSLRSEPDPRRAKWPAGVYRKMCSAEDWLKAWKVNDWNHCRLRCVGKYPRVNVWINGLHVCDWDGANCTLPGYDKEKVFKTLGRTGSIGLQVHGGKGWPNGSVVKWKGIRVRDI